MPDAYTAYSGNYSTSATTWTNWATEWYASGTSATNIWTHWTDGTAGTNTWNACEYRGQTDWAAHEQHAGERKAARERAKEILERHLTEEQRAQLAREQFFVVRGSAGKRYRVKQGRAGNVEMLDDKGQAVERLCAHPAIWCPDEDTMLAQKLALESDEESYRKIANITRVA